MKAIVLAHFDGADLRPLSDRSCPALLPVVGRSLFAHTLDALAAVAVREAVVVAGSYADELRSAAGDGARWGMRIEYASAPVDDWLVATCFADAPEVLVVRADQLRTPCLSDFIAKARATRSAEVRLHIGGRDAGVRLVRRCENSTPGNAELVEVDDARLNQVESLAAYHAANLDAAAGRFEGLIVPALAVAEGLRIARHSRVAEAASDGTVFVGPRCEVARGARLERGVVLQGDVFVDRGASLRSCVVLPDTYVGEIVRLEDAIVWGDLLIDIRRNRIARIDDPVILGSLSGDSNRVGIREWVRGWFRRAA